MYVCIHIYIYICIHTMYQLYLSLSIYTCNVSIIYIYMYIYIYIHTYMCVYIYIYIYIYIYVFPPRRFAQRVGPSVSRGGRLPLRSAAARSLFSLLHILPKAPEVHAWLDKYMRLRLQRWQSAGYMNNACRPYSAYKLTRLRRAARRTPARRAAKGPERRDSRFIKGGCSGNRVQWFVGSYILVHYIILPPSTAPPSHCTPLWGM